MATIAYEIPPRLRPPREALRRLKLIAPSDRSLAELLGTDNHAIAGWWTGSRRMRKPYVDVVPLMDALAERLTEAGLVDDDVVHIIGQPWPELASRLPVEAMKMGEVEPVLKAVPRLVEQFLHTNRLAGKRTRQQETGVFHSEEDLMTSGHEGSVSARLAEAMASRPAPLSGEFAFFKPYNVDEEFAQGRIGNLRETETPAGPARGRIVGMTSDEPIGW